MLELANHFRVIGIEKNADKIEEGRIIVYFFVGLVFMFVCLLAPIGDIRRLASLASSAHSSARSSARSSAPTGDQYHRFALTFAKRNRR